MKLQPWINLNLRVSPFLETYMKPKCGGRVRGNTIKKELTYEPVRPLAASQYASDLYQISRPPTPHISRDMSVPNSTQDWDILVFLSPCLLRHAPTFKRTGHPAGPISGERFSWHGDIRFWTDDKCQNQIFSIFYISSSTGPYGESFNLPFRGVVVWQQRKKRTEWQHPVLEI